MSMNKIEFESQAHASYAVIVKWYNPCFVIRIPVFDSPLRHQCFIVKYANWQARKLLTFRV